MGSVFKGTLDDGRTVAIKRMPASNDAWEELIAHRELNLSHPGLIATLAMTETRGEISVIAGIYFYRLIFFTIFGSLI